MNLRRTVVVAFLTALIVSPTVSATDIKIANDASQHIGFGRHPAGTYWSDFTGDGWLDLAVAYGADAQNRQSNVYANENGTIKTAQIWDSYDHRPGTIMHCGDINGDGIDDLIVPSSGRYIDRCPPQPQHMYFFTPGREQVADWVSDSINAWTCVTGDPDGDGDIDVAFGCGSPPTGDFQRSRIHFNVDGMLEQVPSWRTDGAFWGVSIAFVDIDGDHDQDVALGARREGVQIFYNRHGVIETTPSWQTDEIIGARQMAFADVNNDGWIDMAVAAMGNSGVYGGSETGAFAVFFNDHGILESEPSWVCDYYYEPSCLAFGDADGDGDLDLAGAGWGSLVGVFENNNGRLSDRFVWSFYGDDAPQYVSWCDIDRDGLGAKTETFTGNGQGTVFRLSLRALQSIDEVRVDGVVVPRSGYCQDIMEGWISLAVPPDAGDEVAISYTYSDDLDLCVSDRAVDIYENLHGEIEPEPDPDDVKILVISDQNQGSNYDINDGLTNIKEYFESYGWDITYAGLTDSLHPCPDYGTTTAGCPTVLADRLIGAIDDIDRYDILSVLPAATQSNLMVSSETLQLIRDAVEEGLVVSAWCRGVRVLAAADVIDGLDVTGSADYDDEYVAAGATFHELSPPIIEGRIVTGVRSNYYRVAMCEAIRTALPPRFLQVTRYPEEPTAVDAVTITAKITDYDPFTDVGLMADLGSGFEAVPLLDDGLHGDGAAGDSVYGAVLPPVEAGTEVRYYLHATDGVTSVVSEEPRMATSKSEYHGYLVSKCCRGHVGDANYSGDPEPTIGDISALIDVLFVNEDWSVVPCLSAADVNQSGGADPQPADITIGDISYLINYLFISGPSAGLPECL